MLGVERVGRHDNFFELGGHSISALRVVTMARTQDIPRLHLSLKDILAKPTLHALAGTAVSPMILLNRNLAKPPPLFCIHSGIGTVLGYLSLAKRFNGVRSVYGIACRTLADPRHRDDTLETMANDYAQLIQTFQPHGPYHFVGWSLGGMLAALVAAKLEEVGHEVAFLGLVDPPVPSLLRKNANVTNWQVGFAGLLQKVCETTGNLPSVPLRLTDPLETEQPLLEWVRSQMDCGWIIPSGAYEGLTAEDLTRRCLIERALDLAIERSANSLRSVNVNVNCWWVKDRSSVEIETISNQLGASRIHHWFVDADHESIINSTELLDSLFQGVKNACI